MSHVLRLRSHDELIAAVPHLLGFQPHDSIVVVPVGGEAPTARLDLPHNDWDRHCGIETLAATYRRHRGCTSLAFLAVTADEADARRSYEALADALTGTQTVDWALWVHDDTWVDLATGETGAASARTATRMAAELVARGRAMPLASREQIAGSLVGNSDRLRRVLPASRIRIDRMTLDDVADEGGWLLHQVHLFQQSQVPPSDHPAARVVAALHQPDLRDLAVAAHTRENAHCLTALWRDLTRRTPPVHRAPVAEVLAFSSWLSGDGALAWTALDLIDNPAEHRIASIVADALQVAAPPRIWDQARHHVRTGTDASRTPVSPTAHPPTPASPDRRQGPDVTP